MGSLTAATAVDPSSQPWGYLAPIELSNRNLENGGASAYRTWFENGVYQGDLVQYSVSSNGELSTTVDLSGPSPVNTAPFTNWSAHVKFASREAANSSWWDTERKVVTWSGSAQVAFRWENLTAQQQKDLDFTAWKDKAGSSDTLDWLRGDRVNEAAAGGNLRTRLSPLQDIVHSNPVYVGAPDEDFTDSAYIKFANDNSSRAPRVYVGSNGGMLHAFNADNGEEVWSYVPSMLINTLDNLASTNYTHSYYVDGELTSADVEVTTGQWRTLLAGSLGAGGKGVFLLDVTKPGLWKETADGGPYSNNRKVLLELGDSTDPDLGHTYGRPIFARLNDDKWYLVFGNGYNSQKGEAKLYLVDVHSGNVTRVATGNKSNNGLSTPALVDLDGDGRIDVAYAGDLDGKLWKFDLPANNSGALAPATPEQLHDAGQPITASPDVTGHPVSGLMVIFGTGRLLTQSDNDDAATVNALYGIWDYGGKAGSGGLYPVTQSADLVHGGASVRSFKTPGYPIDWIGSDANTGWMVTLEPGERVVTPPQIRAGRAKFTVVNPSIQENWILEPSIVDGGPAATPIYDLDADGKLDADDKVDQNGDGDVADAADVPGGWQLPGGLVSRITIARLSAGLDTAFYNNLYLPVRGEPCTGSCTGGLEGGHFDLTTDSPSKKAGNGFANHTTRDTHAYDDMFDTTEADYFDLQDSHANADTAIPASSHNNGFIVLLANADLSTGGRITIGNKTWNVVEYQAMLHRKLRSWNGSDPLEDDGGDSLVFSINDIRGLSSAGNPLPGTTPGDLKISFDSDAIRSGGLHPTLPSCVVRSNYQFLQNDRWRNGALVMQLVDTAALKKEIPGGGSALDALTVQSPPDLRDPVMLADGTQISMSDGIGSYPSYGGARIPGTEHTSGDPDIFLYESTIFWHFDGETCYGEPDWEEEAKTFMEGLSDDDFLNLTGYTVSEYLSLSEDDFRDCKEITSGKTNKGVAGCEEEYKAWQAARELIGFVRSTWGGGADGGTGEGFEPTSGAALTTGTLTPVPKGYSGSYRYGRQVWSDYSED
jgi:hypothetical protein